MPSRSRRTGVLSAWDDVKSRGSVLVSETNEVYFICKRFILSGKPVIGATVTFEPHPAKEGMTFPQAAFAVIDNRKRMTALELLSGKAGAR